jgi:hypothetical protein
MPQTTERIKLIYIAGSGRSGSTLLEKILGQNQGITALGEVCNIWFANPPQGQCGCGKALVDCEFWGHIFSLAFPNISATYVKHMQELGVESDRLRYIPAILFSLGTDKKAEEYMAGMKKLYSAAYSTRPGSILLDSSKKISWLYLLSQHPEFEIYVIHLVRDARGVVYSWSKTAEQLSRQHGRDVALPVIHPYKAGISWFWEQYLAARMRSQFHGYLNLRYEDLIMAPNTTLLKVYKFIGLESHTIPAIHGNQISLPTPIHSISGNPIRLSTGLTQLTLDQEWQNKMPSGIKFMVTLLTLPYLIRYRYL